MFEMFERLIERLRIVWAGMTLNQKVVTGGVLAALFIAALYISTLSERMIRYTVLFANLDAESASETIAHLEEENIPYRLTRGGTAIEVPVEQADRLKIQLIAEGLPERGIIGYEILDTTNFGMSDFLQKINYKIALEGELSRTLRTLNEVDYARVHLVIPEPSLFIETAQPPTATVVLTMKSGRTLPPHSVEAIANLVASAAVEGLNPRDVTIVDTRGTQLIKPVLDEFAMQSSTFMDLKFSYEKRLADNVKRMLDGAFGSGIALVIVNADLDFDSISRMTTSYDQENSAIMGEERTEVTNPTAEGGGEETISTNYDTGSIVENLVRTPGSTVRRLTVSVLIDGKDQETVDDEGVMHIEKVPWSDEELVNIRANCEAAVGYNPERGDRLVVANMAFSAREIVEPLERLTMRANIVEIVKAVTTGVAILAALGLFFIIVRSIIRTLDPSRMKISEEEKFEKYMPEIPEEVQVSEKSDVVRKIIARAVKEPEMTAKAIKSIYRE